MVICKRIFDHISYNEIHYLQLASTHAYMRMDGSNKVKCEPHWQLSATILKKTSTYYRN